MSIGSYRYYLTEKSKITAYMYLDCYTTKLLCDLGGLWQVLGMVESAGTF